MPILLILFIVPLFSSILLFALKRLPARFLKNLAILLSLIPLALLLINHTNLLGSKVLYKWLPGISIDFHLAVDSLSLVFLYLTAIIVPISLLAARSKTLESPNVFYGLVLLLQGLLIGFFMARDLALFTIFWESMLLPLYFLINIWGGPQRRSAAMKFLLYMIAGSALMVAAVLALYFAAGTFNMDELANMGSFLHYGVYLFAIFALAFAVKTPLFPFHAWLPDTYYEASTAGTILLSAILSKAGIYGFLRIGMEIFPKQVASWSLWLMGLAIAGVFYGAFCAWAQKDYKRLIAYSSLSHVNFILAGVFALAFTAQSGAILQSLNHGISIAALFLAAGWLAERLGTTSLLNVGGLAKYMPKLCWITFLFVLSSVALPGTNGFVGELLILLGIFTVHPWAAAILALTVILSVVYMLRWMQKMYFQEPSPVQPSWVDLHAREIVVALPLITLILWIGIYPSPVLDLIKPAADKIMTSVTTEPAK